MTTYDFGDGPVPAHRHKNPDGTKGGWVANTAMVEPTAYVGADARVSGNAVVYGDAEAAFIEAMKGNADTNSATQLDLTKPVPTKAGIAGFGAPDVGG
jgi:hypothetical protein